MYYQIINSCDVVSDVDDPPLLDLGNACMTIYRSDADYRQNLFMQGQDTFVTIGGGFILMAISGFAFSEKSQEE